MFSEFHDFLLLSDNGRRYTFRNAFDAYKIIFVRLWTFLNPPLSVEFMFNISIMTESSTNDKSWHHEEFYEISEYPTE